MSVPNLSRYAPISKSINPVKISFIEIIWNNIYLTLLKLDRIDDARKCKEILDRLEYEPEITMKGVADRPYKRFKQVLAVIIVILLALSILLASLSILGWVSYREVIPVAPEQYVGDMMNITLSGFIKIVNSS